MFKATRYAIKECQFGSILRSPHWFLTMHFPYILKYWIQSMYLPQHKTVAYNSRVWDGMTRNDFKRGNLLQFLAKLGAIKKPLNWDSDELGRGYFIGYIENDD